MAAIRIVATRLASMLAFATQPQARAQELAKSLLAADLPATLAVDLHDLKDLERRGARHTDVGAWIYAINALNSDKGYDRMIVEMLAGDEVADAFGEIISFVRHQ